MGPPFPTSNAAWDPPQPTGYFTERTVHQVYFKIFSFYNDRRELWITEIDHRGYARTREPETYFYFLTGDDSYARHTSDYWRAFFQIPTRHFDNPFHYTATDNYQHHHLHLLPLHPPQATLAAQLQERLFTSTTSEHGPTVISNRPDQGIVFRASSRPWRADCRSWPHRALLTRLSAHRPARDNLYDLDVPLPKKDPAAAGCVCVCVYHLKRCKYFSMFFCM